MLKFYARENQLVTDPDFRPVVGQPPAYVGRKSVLVSGRCAYPATKEPFEVDEGSKAGRRLVKLCRRDGCLFPADKATAVACGVEFVQPIFDGGVWRAPIAPAPEAKKQKAAKAANTTEG